MTTVSFSQFLRAVTRPQVYGMVHVGALPGAPLATNSVSKICEAARRETETYANCGVDGIVFENMHDVPYQTSVGPEVVACMTRVCHEAVRTLANDRSKFKLGVQVLAGANREALSVAHATELDFVRVEGFVFSHVADEGLSVCACAGNLLRYRKQIEAESIAILADIKKKHCSHSITADVSIVETARAAQFFLADGLILTGVSTSSPACDLELKEVSENSALPVLIGSGVTLQNAKKYRRAKAFIIGSYFKKKGLWQNDLEPSKIKEFMKFIKNECN